jgi:hypothetical protein
MGWECRQNEGEKEFIQIIIEETSWKVSTQGLEGNKS